VFAATVFLCPTPIPQDRPLSEPLDAGDALRIVVLGTSLTANYDWPEILENRLDTCLPNGVEVHVIAAAGQNASWGLKQVDRIVAVAADVVVIEFAINDADILDGLSLGQAAADYDALIDGLRARGDQPAIVLMTMSPTRGLRGMMRPRLGRHYAQYRDLAQAKDVGLVDLYPRWRTLPRSSRGLERDGLHPDPHIAAQVIVPVLAEYLVGAAGISCIPINPTDNR